MRSRHIPPSESQEARTPRGPLRVPVAPLRSGRLELDEGTSRYVVRVHRLGPGAPLLLFDPEAGLEATAELVSDRLPRAEIEVGEVTATAARPGWRVTLLQAIGKGDKPEQVVRDATVLGAQRVVFVETERCVARASGADRRLRERRVAVEAARQAGRGDLPELVGPRRLAATLADMATAEHKLVCGWASDAEPLLVALESWLPEQELVLLIGPEGGLTSGEVQAARQAGFRPVSLGAFVLRTETAATVALGIVQSYAEAQRFRTMRASSETAPAPDDR